MYDNPFVEGLELGIIEYKARIKFKARINFKATVHKHLKKLIKARKRFS
jgi:hypothetical protein